MTTAESTMPVSFYLHKTPLGERMIRLFLVENSDDAGCRQDDHLGARDVVIRWHRRVSCPFGCFNDRQFSQASAYLRVDRAGILRDRRVVFAVGGTCANLAISVQARRVSETLHAWAIHPRGVKGGSPSKISAMLPMP